MTVTLIYQGRDYFLDPAYTAATVAGLLTEAMNRAWADTDDAGVRPRVLDASGAHAFDPWLTLNLAGGGTVWLTIHDLVDVTLLSDESMTLVNDRGSIHAHPGAFVEVKGRQYQIDSGVVRILWEVIAALRDQQRSFDLDIDGVDGTVWVTPDDQIQVVPEPGVDPYEWPDLTQDEEKHVSRIAELRASSGRYTLHVEGQEVAASYQ